MQRIIHINIIIMLDFNLIMAIVLPVLQSLMFIVETVYYVVKTVKELS